jgi:site-specific DNA-methyltransferase (adenine-specific)
MTPGEHIVSEIPRAEGMALRDTFLVLLPGPTVLPLFLRRERLEGNVVETLLKHGHGALNIDGCRTDSSEVLSGGGGKLWSHYRDGTEDQAKPSVNEDFSRWPTNLILVHGPDCASGTCQADCPVRLLDEMCGFYSFPVIGDDPGEADSASRYFPQFANLDEAMAWLHKLIGATG